MKKEPGGNIYEFSRNDFDFAKFLGKARLHNDTAI
jgi:hypothetical protein